MRRRCNNPQHPQYDDYGGRGIKVCRLWDHKRGFPWFLRSMGPKPSPAHSLERRNNNEGYHPANCRWAVQPEQNRNTRRNVMIEFDGRSMCLTDWAAEMRIKRGTLESRINRLGWSPERALITPTDTRYRTDLY